MFKILELGAKEKMLEWLLSNPISSSPKSDWVSVFATILLHRFLQSQDYFARFNTSHLTAQVHQNHVIMTKITPLPIWFKKICYHFHVCKFSFPLWINILCITESIVYGKLVDCKMRTLISAAFDCYMSTLFINAHIPLHKIVLSQLIFL